MSDRWVEDSGILGQVVIDCAVGDTVKVCHSKFKRGLQNEYLFNGFRLSNPDLGELKISDEWRCVYYKHNKSGKQIIEFIDSLTRSRDYIEISGSIRIHDHASIPEGGPAFATYFSEIEDEEGEGT